MPEGAAPTTPVTPPAEPTTPVTPVEPTTPVTPPADPAAPVAPAEPVAPIPPVVAPVVPPTPVEPVTEPTAPTPQAERVIPKPDGYKLPEGVPEQFGQFAHDQQLTQEQLDATFMHFNAFSEASQKVQQQQLRESGEEFINSWGENKDYNLGIAQRALAQNDPDGKVTEFLNTTGFGNHPVVLKFLFTIGNFMREGGFLKSGPIKSTGKKTDAQVLYPNHPSKET